MAGRVGRAQRKEAGRAGLSQSGGSNLDDEETQLIRGDEPDLLNGPNNDAPRDRERGDKGETDDRGDRDGGKDAEPGDGTYRSEGIVGSSNQDGKTDDDGPSAGGAAGTGGGRASRNRGGKTGTGNQDGNSKNDDIENQNMVNRDMTMGPMRIMEPIRADPVKALQARQKRLERFAATGIPEIHFVGQISSGVGLIDDATEGVCVRWKVDTGKAWEHLGGETLGQTQVAYCRSSDQEAVPFNHPLDLHFAEAGLQGWGAPRIAFQCYKLDWHGRRLLVGYAFEHLPTTPGAHRMEVNLWRPVGSPEQELDSFLLGRVPALVSHEPLYESAWKERCRLVTTAAGRVYLDLFVITRNMERVGVDMN